MYEERFCFRVLYTRPLDRSKPPFGAKLENYDCDRLHLTKPPSEKKTMRGASALSCHPNVLSMRSTKVAQVYHFSLFLIKTHSVLKANTPEVQFECSFLVSL